MHLPQLLFFYISKTKDNTQIFPYDMKDILKDGGKDQKNVQNRGNSTQFSAYWRPQ